MIIRKDFNYLLVSLSRLMRTVVKREMSHSVLTFEQTRALSYISRFEGITQTALAELLEAKVMATSKAIQMLQSLKLVERKRDQGDRRSYQLYLTEQGKDEVKKIFMFSQKIYQRVTHNIPEEELTAFYHTMIKIQKNLQSVNHSDGSKVKK